MKGGYIVNHVRSVAVMQPYFLPYIGYFQLMAAVDVFVIYDDVNFIKRGWINRNRLLLDKQPKFFTVPLQAASQNRRICEISLVDDQKWRDRMLKSLHHAYVKAPYYLSVRPMMERILSSNGTSLSSFVLNGLREVSSYLQMTGEIRPSSAVYGNADLAAQERIIDICRREGAELYINPAGGTDLYQAEAFRAVNIELVFIKPRPLSYLQAGDEHVPWLSIVDVLMYNPISTVRQYLREVDLSFP